MTSQHDGVRREVSAMLWFVFIWMWFDKHNKYENDPRASYSASRGPRWSLRNKHCSRGWDRLEFMIIMQPRSTVPLSTSTIKVKRMNSCGFVSVQKSWLWEHKGTKKVTKYSGLSYGKVKIKCQSESSLNRLWSIRKLRWTMETNEFHKTCTEKSKCKKVASTKGAKGWRN